MAVSRRIVVLIPAAGKSQRYQAAGYATPKPFLEIEWNGERRRMIDHVLWTLPWNAEEIVIGVPPGYARQLPSKCTSVPVPFTRGQADTLLQLVRHTRRFPDPRVLVVNSDILLPAARLRELLQSVKTNAMALLVQKADNPAMSYVDKVPHPTRYAEKERISDYGISGAWAFQSFAAFGHAVAASVHATGPGEPYLSHALDCIKGQHHAIVIEPHELIDWNTPEALEASGAHIVEEAK